jgi:hypothetical protein
MTNPVHVSRSSPRRSLRSSTRNAEARRAGLVTPAILLLLFSAELVLPAGGAAQQASAGRATAQSATTSAVPLPVSDNPAAHPPPGDSIGVIDGDAIAITGPMSVEVVHGQVKTVLRSGSDVRVKSGSAHIALVEGGQITICGPAHLSILKSGGAVTVALESGTIHAQIEQSPILTVYTAQIKAQPLSIGDAALDLLVGFDPSGLMCVRAAKGAVRLEQQLSGQSLVIPQTGDVLLTNGQLESLQTSSGRCLCEVSPMNGPTDVQSSASVEPQPEVSQLATAEDLRKRTFDAKPNLPPPQQEKAAPKEAPIYQVVVPPLVYIANAKVQPDIDPAMIILVRRVRVRPTVIFQGRVLDEPADSRSTTTASNAIPATITPAAKTPASSTPASSPSLVNRVKTFIQKLWTPGS